MSIITLGFILTGAFTGAFIGVFFGTFLPPPAVASLSGLVDFLAGDALLSSLPLTELPVDVSLLKFTLTMILSSEVNIDFSDVELSLKS